MTVRSRVVRCLVPLIAVLAAAAAAAVPATSSGAGARAVRIPPIPRVYDFDMRLDADYVVSSGETSGDPAKPCEGYRIEKGRQAIDVGDKQGSGGTALFYSQQRLQLRNTVTAFGDAAGEVKRTWSVKGANADTPGCPAVCPPGVGGSSLGVGLPRARAADCLPAGAPFSPPADDCGSRDYEAGFSGLLVSEDEDAPLVGDADDLTPLTRTTFRVALSRPEIKRPWRNCPFTDDAPVFAPLRIAVSPRQLRNLKAGRTLTYANEIGPRKCRATLPKGHTCTYKLEVGIEFKRKVPKRRR